MARLLLVDPAGRAMLCDLDSGERFALDQTHAQTGSPKPSRARTAVWSPAGRWAATALDSGELASADEVRYYPDPAGASGASLLASACTAFYLCPSPCGRYLSHLSPGPLGLELAVSEVATGELVIVERGQPLFWSWSPDSSQLAVHVGPRHVVVTLSDGQVRLLCEESDPFVAPWWLPDGSVIGAADHQITSYGPDGSAVALAQTAGTSRFSPDPDGRRLAMVDLIEGTPVLVVKDLLTGERDVVVAQRTAGFFWSPEGRRLAALVLAGPAELQWVVFDGSETVRLAPFRPANAWMSEVLPFFEQYAHSHSVWSGTGNELVAATTGEDGEPEAVVQSVDGAQADQRIPGARLAWWAAG